MRRYDLRVTENHAYGNAPANSLDLYVPLTASPPPVVLYLHGGAFEHGDKTIDVGRIRNLASRGIAVASANYRLAPNTLYPGQILDCKQAVAWLRRNSVRLGLNGDTIGVWGASAGGYLASMVGLTSADEQLTRAEDLGMTKVDAVVTWFGFSDIPTSTNRTLLEEQLLPPAPEAVMLGPDRLSRETQATASPVSRVCAGAPPFLIAHGDLDQLIPIRQSSALHDALVTQGASSTMITLGGAGHEATEFNSATSLAMTAAFLISHLDQGDIRQQS